MPVRIGGVTLGGDAPVIVQSMTNTDTADIDATTKQVAALARAGSELVRITVDRAEAAAAVPHIRERLDILGVATPLIGDFHYNGHTLLAEHPACAEALAKYRINPGNVGFKDKRDKQFGAIIEIATRHGKAIRIGVNWGSLDQDLLTRLMDENARDPVPKDARQVMHEAIVQSALLSAERAMELGLPADKIVLSAKVSAVQDLIAVYAMLAARSELALHLGLTEAGMGSKGIVASSAALAVLLQHGIGDTIRISLTPEPGGDRTLEVKVAQELLQSMGFRSFVPARRGVPRLRTHHLDHVPGARQRHPELHPRPDAGMETALSRCRDDVGRGDGLHRQWAGGIEARRYRHLASGHGRGAGGAGLRRWQEGDDVARPQSGRRVQADGARLYRAAFRPRPHRPHGRGVANDSETPCPRH